MQAGKRETFNPGFELYLACMSIWAKLMRAKLTY